MTKEIVRKGFWMVVFLLAAAPSVRPQPLPTAQRSQPRSPGDGATRTDQPDRAYRGLFGAGQDLNGTLAMTFSVSQEYSTDLAADSEGLVLRPLVQQSGIFTGFRGDLGYSRRTPRVAVTFRADGGLRYYPASALYTRPRFQSAVDISAALDRHRRSALRLGQTVQYTPYGLVVFQAPADPVFDRASLGADRDDQLLDRAHYIHGSTLGYSYDLTPRLKMSVEGEYRFTQSADPSFDVRQFYGKASVSRRVTEYVALQGGYGFRRGELPSERTFRTIDSHDIDIGVAYNRPLTRSRKTTISITTGSALFGDAGARKYQLIGSAKVHHQMPKRWTAQIGYDRGWHIAEGFSEPLLTDGVAMTMSGFVTPRLELSIAGGYVAGTAGFTGRQFDNAQGSARLRYALSRHVAIDGQYLLDRFDFDEGISLLPLVPHQQQRHSARVAIALWLPITH